MTHFIFELQIDAHQPKRVGPFWYGPGEIQQDIVDSQFCSKVGPTQFCLALFFLCVHIYYEPGQSVAIGRSVGRQLFQLLRLSILAVGTTSKARPLVTTTTTPEEKASPETCTTQLNSVCHHKQTLVQHTSHPTKELCQPTSAPNERLAGCLPTHKPIARAQCELIQSYLSGYKYIVKVGHRHT